MKRLSEEAREQLLEDEWNIIEEKIRSGEIDLSDDAPTYVPSGDCQRFIEESLDYIEKKLLPAANSEVSFFESLLAPVVASFRSGDAMSLRAHHALFLLWDTARMQHEGRPPYSISFSQQVSDALGIDPVAEASRIETPDALPNRFLREALAAFKVASIYFPKYAGEIMAMERNILALQK